MAEKQARAQRRRRRRLRRRVARIARWAILVTGAFLVVVCGWVALEARGVQSDLESAARGISTLQQQVLSGETADVQTTIADVQQHSQEAARVTGRPHWTVVTALPFVGPNVDAVRTVSGAVDHLAQGALPSLQAAVEVVNPSSLAPVDGAIDLTPLTEAAPAVVQADAVVQDSLASLEDIDREQLLPFVADAVDQAAAELADASTQTRTAARVVQLLPSMLGGDGPRDYLLLVQNNAEQRATGGIPGVVLQIHVDDGNLEIVDQQSGVSIGAFREPVSPLGDDEVALFGTQLGRFIQDVTFTPDFPRTGELAAAMWLDRFDVEVDGVMSVDPVALQAVLGATGPLTVDGVELTDENAADVLLNGIYLDRPDPQAQDAFFAGAATAMFDALSSGSGDPGRLVRALAEQASHGRLLVWSTHSEEQAQLTGTQIAGELVGQVADRPVVGVFVNDGSAAKIGYYLETDISLESAACRPDGSQALSMRVTLTSTAPADAADLPGYITGAGAGVVEPGQQRFNVLIYAPANGSIGSITASDGDSNVLSQVHGGLPVAARTVTLAPGEELELTVELLSGPAASGAPVLRTTPGPRPVVAEAVTTSCSGA